MRRAFRVSQAVRSVSVQSAGKGQTMTLMNSLLMFAQQGAAPAGQTATTTPAPATPAPAPMGDLEAAKARGAEAAEAAAGHSEVSLWDLVTKLNEVELGVMIILAVCAVYAVALLFEKIYVMRKAAGQTKDFLSAFRKANSVEEAEAIVRKLPASSRCSMRAWRKFAARKTSASTPCAMRATTRCNALRLPCRRARTSILKTLARA
jgi:hypothetical protein